MMRWLSSSLLGLIVLASVPVSSDVPDDIVQEESVISCYVNLADSPDPMPGMRIARHQRGSENAFLEKRDDELFMDGKKVKLLPVSLLFEYDDSIGYREVAKKLRGRKILNANFLDALLLMPDLIPGTYAWHATFVRFCGTLYRKNGGAMCVRQLNYDAAEKTWKNSYQCSDDPGLWRNGIIAFAVLE